MGKDNNNVPTAQKVAGVNIWFWIQWSGSPVVDLSEPTTMFHKD